MLDVVTGRRVRPAGHCLRPRSVINLPTPPQNCISVSYMCDIIDFCCDLPRSSILHSVWTGLSWRRESPLWRDSYRSLYRSARIRNLHSGGYSSRWILISAGRDAAPDARIRVIAIPAFGRPLTPTRPCSAKNVAKTPNCSEPCVDPISTLGSPQSSIVVAA